VKIDLGAVQKNIEGRVVLITGAAGSIGSELCRQILSYRPQALLCVDRSETGIFHLQQELSKSAAADEVLFCIADIDDRERMREIFEHYEPTIVFHAAAYKHVPLMEQNVREAVKNNVLALISLIEIAEANGCEAFVLISSDKAVNPTSIMGVTKRIGELIVASRSCRGMDCVSVRFGNVLGSNGSVIPLFEEQLKAGRPLSITHPEIERFFMTTREAVSLALQAFTIGNRGDTLVLDMGKPVRILHLAKTLIRLSGRSEGDVPIHFTGLRPGEKLTEELFYGTEQVLSTSFDKIKRIPGAAINWPLLERDLAELRALVAASAIDRIRLKLQEMVPEYSPAGFPSTSRFLRIDQPSRRRKVTAIGPLPAIQRRTRRSVGIDAD
jgi:FlaA1/EpsC-like NDP-sugar epimerase